MHALDLEGRVVQKPALSTLAESPSGLSSDTTSSSSEAASVTQGLAVAPRLNSLKRSPLGRSVVTALEAELDQVAKHVTAGHSPDTTHHCTADKQGTALLSCLA